jgi:type IX secretion system PorP/SprF family membrane protein
VNTLTQHIPKKGWILLLTLSLALSALNVNAQQLFSYTQYMNNPVPLNPAASMLERSGSVSAIMRRQWTGIEGSPSTFIFNGQLPIEEFGAAAGLMVLNDQFAVEHLTEINGFFAKSIQLAKDQYLSVSLNGGIRRYNANYSALDPTDPQFRNDIRETKPNIGFGVLFHGTNYYAGIAVPQFTTRSLGTASQVNNSFFRSHYNFSGAYLFGEEADEIRPKPSVLATYAKGVPFILDFSTTIYIKNTLGVGANYRTNTELAGILTYTSDLLKVGYSYQFGTAANNVARGFRNNTHEISLTYRFGKYLEQHSLL